ncbi:hypothetical protein BLA23254_07436 [Burkholderia lata]|uniref:Uncharacterized protein n=1 Tax=Burkholderia lata (strain ATCC 17760 / DSM 23089 / LMG 22485 / NCIMB 9086 / R18194 / 383) TaxID=482957 RepID=A0A6P2SG65_BURL3|nr:hypothetical protein [Burkholderia lata]VWC46959.1 hypothetical protein BLA23254_07436 [Burkholderia lata]
MGSVTMFFTRVLAQAFPGGPRQSTVHQPPPGSNVRTVGTGALNETFVTIGGMAHLFVDEGDSVVEFVPAFDDAPGDTMFGTKILPALAPHWAMLSEHEMPLKDAIATAIRRESLPASPASSVASAPADSGARAEQSQGARQSTEDAEFEPRTSLPMRESSRSRNQRGGNEAAGRSPVVEGRITSWGEETFPDRRPGKSRSYRSFAIHLDTRNGDETLQGEGLKEAISECGCRVGDLVKVKRLRKIKVPAFRKEDGSPIYKDGQQVMWDKWLWSITK